MFKNVIDIFKWKPCYYSKKLRINDRMGQMQGMLEPQRAILHTVKNSWHNIYVIRRLEKSENVIT